MKGLPGDFFMNYVFSLFLLSGIFFFFQNGTLGELITVISDSCVSCSAFVLKLMFLTAFFSGIIQIADDCGVVKQISSLLSCMLRKIFRTKNEAILQKISVNISANMLGIGNAATPSGLAAMEELDKENKHHILPSSDMCRFMLFNTCSVQLIPTTVLSLRAMAGSKNPSVILIPVLAVSLLCLTAGILMCKLFYGYFCRSRFKE